MDLDSSSHGQIGSVTEELTAKLAYNSTAKVLLGDIQSAYIDTDSSSVVQVKGTIHSGKITAAYNSTVRAARFGPGVRFDADPSSNIIAK